MEQFNKMRTQVRQYIQRTSILSRKVVRIVIESFYLNVPSLKQSASLPHSKLLVQYLPLSDSASAGPSDICEQRLPASLHLGLLTIRCLLLTAHSETPSIQVARFRTGHETRSLRRASFAPSSFWVLRKNARSPSRMVNFLTILAAISLSIESFKSCRRWNSP